MGRVACIDVGTVTARLAVCDVEGGRVRRMAKTSTICNLGEGLSATGRIGDAARARVLDCVDRYLANARQAAARVVCCTLTSAARDASNSAELEGDLVARGLLPEVIAGRVEGSLTFLGVAQDFPDERILVADNGGGSTELAVGSLGERGLRLEAVTSVDVGCRRVTERFLPGDGPASDDQVAAARAFCRGPLETAFEGEGLRDRASRLVVTGGTVTSLVAVRDALVPYDPLRVHLSELGRDDVESLAVRIAGLSLGERAELPGLQPKRSGVILGGALAVVELMGVAGFDRLTVSESDLLFGLAICAEATRTGAESPLGWHPRLAPLR